MTTTPTLWRAAQQAHISDAGSAGDDQDGVHLVGLANGNFVAVWHDNSDAEGKNGTDVIGQIYDPLGNGVGGEFRVNTFFGDDEENHAVAALPNGNFVVVYEDSNDNGTSIQFVVRNPAGAFVGSGTIVADSDNLARGRPSVIVGENGSFLVSYQEDPPASVSSGDVIVVEVNSSFEVRAPDRRPSTDPIETDSGVRSDIAMLSNGALAS